MIIQKSIITFKININLRNCNLLYKSITRVKNNVFTDTTIVQ